MPLFGVDTNSPSFLLTAGLVSCTMLALGRRHFAGAKCKLVRDLSNQIIIVTGSSGGLGKETARTLAAMNSTIIVASRDQQKSLAAVEEIRKLTNNQKVEFMHLDLADLRSVKQFSKTFKQKYNKLDVLINNAGVAFLPTRTLTKDGFEAQFGINHLGHFYLTLLLLDVLKKSAPSRIINLSSDAGSKGKINWDDLMNEKNYNPFLPYMQSKLANVIFTKELQNRLQGTNVKAFALHPGMIITEIWRYYQQSRSVRFMFAVFYPLIRYMGKTVEQGVQTTLYCALEDFEKLNGGAYFADCKEHRYNPEAYDEKNQKMLWEVSEKLIKEKLGEDAFE